MLFYYYCKANLTVNLILTFSSLHMPLEIIIWKAQGVPQYNNVAHPKHQEEEEISPNRKHIITGKQQQTNLALSSPTEVIDQLPFTYK